MFTLIAIGVGVAYIYSAVATLLPQIFPDTLRTHGGQPEVYFEAAAAIIVLVLLGPDAGASRAQPHRLCHSRTA